MIAKLKSFLKTQKIDFFLLPNSDEFFLEYLPNNQKRIEHLTGFNGSNATIIFGQDKSYFFTDGRYTLQAKEQLDENEFEIFNIAQTSVISWLESNLKNTHKLALDSKLHSVSFVEQLTKISPNLILLDENPVDQNWTNRPSKNNSEIFFLNEKQSGKSSAEKRQEICQNIASEALLITKPENICWLLNLRASEIDFTPFLVAYAIIFKNGKIDLFVDESRMPNLENPNLHNVNIVDPNCLDLRIAILRKSISSIEIDTRTTNCWIYQLLEENKFKIIRKNDPFELPKSLKNLAEINGAIKSHEIDGLALTKFLLWIKKNYQTDEISAAEKLLNFRKENPDFFYESFAAISGFASNGAIIHYHANPKTNKKFSANELYLIDSGGQYLGDDFCGTTDVTRTIVLGKPNSEMVENFTRVLKGHIALARAVFPIGTTGAQLDVLARQHLWRKGLDFDHGTGHGVGSFLSVHEGPCGVSKRNHQPLLPGMIISNEPGFYKEGEYGIRIENLMLVEELNKKFLQFKTLTLAPIDADLIDFKMLTFPEKKWLKEYHQKIFNNLEKFLDSTEKEDLKNLLNNYLFS